MSTDLATRDWNGTPISRRIVDGYVNATAMCKANGKQWNDYWRTDRATQYLEALSAKTGNPVIGQNGLIVSIQGPHGGTWVHERVAVDLARWLSPQFAVWMDGWFVDETKKQADLNSPGRQQARLKGKKARIALQDTLFEHDVTDDGPGMGAVTNVIYQIAFGDTAAGLRKQMNLPKSVTPRERMSEADLNRLNVHETVLGAQVNLQDTRGNAANILLASNCGHAVEALLNKPITGDMQFETSEPQALPEPAAKQVVNVSPYEIFKAEPVDR